MKKIILAVVVLFCLAHTANSQNKTYLGLEFSMFHDVTHIQDNSNYLTGFDVFGPQGGITIRQAINRKIFVETGAIVKLYEKGFGFDPSPVYVGLTDPNISPGDLSLLIPLRFGLNVNLYQQKIYFVPVIGYSYGINAPSVYEGSSGTRQSFGRAISITYNVTDVDEEYGNFSLLQTGIGFEFHLFRTLLLSISTNYYKGFNEIYQLDIDYTVDNSNPTSGTITSKGDFWCVSTGIRYPISNFWTSRGGE
jgi:hypothetical protein